MNKKSYLSRTLKIGTLSILATCATLNHVLAGNGTGNDGDNPIPDKTQIDVADNEFFHLNFCPSPLWRSPLLYCPLTNTDRTALLR